jgi:uncharacterized protein (TIGR00369 family)
MTPRFDGFEAKIRDSFARQDMMRTLGATLDGIAPGKVDIACPVLPEMRQQHGFAHAAVSFAIGDSAAGYAALSLMDEGDEVLTVEMKINLLAPASGDRLLARGHVIRAGRRLVVVGASVFAETNGRQTQVALLQGTMIPVARP